MLPLWLYTLGTVFLVDSELQIPFETVAVSLSLLIVPLLAGVFLRHKYPRAADKLGKALKPVILVMSIILLGVGIYSNLYIFRMFKLNIIAAGLLLPYVGFILGGVIAFVCRQSWPRVKTISIETGMQNTNIAYILLTTSFPAPLGDIAAIAPVASAVMTPLPPFIGTIIYLAYQKYKKKTTDDKKASSGDGEEEEEAAERLTSPDETHVNGKTEDTTSAV